MANAGRRKPHEVINRLPRAASGTAPMTGLPAAAAEPPRHQECALCLELYESPRILSCFHTFCLACLEQLVRSNSAAASFPCPTCRTAVQVPSGGVGKFQVNFYVEAAMENLQISQRGNIHVCDMCGEGNISSKCVDCDQFACDSCTKVHARTGTTKSHTVLNLNAQSQAALVVQERFCTTHTDEKIEGPQYDEYSQYDEYQQHDQYGEYDEYSGYDEYHQYDQYGQDDEYSPYDDYQQYDQYGQDDE